MSAASAAKAAPAVVRARLRLESSRDTAQTAQRASPARAGAVLPAPGRQERSAVAEHEQLPPEESHRGESIQVGLRPAGLEMRTEQAACQEPLGRHEGSRDRSRGRQASGSPPATPPEGEQGDEHQAFLPQEARAEQQGGRSGQPSPAAEMPGPARTVRSRADAPRWSGCRTGAACL